MPDNYLQKRTGPFGPGYISLKLLLETNMQLYVVNPTSKVVSPIVPQPAGYPKGGERVKVE